MSEKNTNVTETVEIDPGMSVMPEGPGPMDVPTVIPELDSMLAAMSSALPAYQTTAWKDKPSTETPIDAAAMTRIEQRLVDLTNAVNGLRDSVSQQVKFSAHIESATLSQNVTAGGEEPIMVRIKTDDPNRDYALCVHKSKRIELYDYVAKRSVWSANLTSLCS